MKKFSLLTLLTASMIVASCLKNNDSYQAGFLFLSPTSPTTYAFANNISDSLVMQCMGPWQITSETPDASWVTIPQMKGGGSAAFSLPVIFSQNTTGRSRFARFTIRDTAHPNDAYNTWQYCQYATRGDGTLGSAALVKSVSSSDGWVMRINYDQQARPVSYELVNPRGSSEKTEITYNEETHKLSVTSYNGNLSGDMDSGYQTELLIGQKDTIGYFPQYYSNGIPVSFNYAFNFISAHKDYGRRLAFSYLLKGQSLAPDSLHKADSLRYSYHLNNPETNAVELLKLKYSSMDNRCQSVDVNQLLLGFANCEPLQLLSLFRYTRSTSIVSQASSSNGTIDVSTELNADYSVKCMTVKDNRTGTEVKYDFAY